MGADEQGVVAFDRPGTVRRPPPGRPHRLRRARVDGVELEYEVLGAGDPVVLIHAGVCADWFAPLLTQPALRDPTASSAITAPGTPAVSGSTVSSASPARPPSARR